MKHKLLTLLTLICLGFGTNAWGQNVEVDGIRYLLDADTKEAKVVSKPYVSTDPDEDPSIGVGLYSGDIVIPDKIQVTDSQTNTTTAYAVTAIADGAFFGCDQLTGISIPNSVTSIGVAAFKLCGQLTSVVLPPGLTEIKEETFAYCTALASVTLPEHLARIERYAFYQWKNLRTIYCMMATPPAFEDFQGFPWDAINGKVTLYVPTGSLAYYQEAEPWMHFQDIREMDFTGVRPAIVDANGVSSASAIYDLRGRKSCKQGKGVNIIRRTDGTTRKVLVR